METFEFLSLLKCHGFPHVMGVLTHLDYYRDNKQLRKTRKKFKKRFEYEVGGNSKLFPLSKWEKGVYPKIEVAKLARYIGTSKPPAFPWRLSHPYLVADRWQTVEDAHYKPDDEVNVAFYGYIRGSSYRVNGKIHLVGLGDFSIANIEVVNDPCPEFKK
jgi:ribosome biogenesis protein BMS1